MRTRIKSAIISCITIQDAKILVRRESKSQLERNVRRVEFEKSYHKGNSLLTSFEMGLKKQLGMFKQQKRYENNINNSSYSSYSSNFSIA